MAGTATDRPRAWQGLLGVVVHLAEQLRASAADNFERSPLYAAAGYDSGGEHLAVVQ